VGGKIQFNVQLKFSSIFYLQLLSHIEEEEEKKCIKKEGG
jgi:hypothetical protein